MTEKHEWNVTFLLDKTPPSKVVMLKRSPDKKYAPNLYTGIGGNVDPEDKTVIDSAYRELEEEARIKNVPLTEFARCIIDKNLIIYYFWGINTSLQLPSSEDGTLEWVETDDILDKEIIPTTHHMCEQWKEKEFVTNPFTVYLHETGMNGTVRLVELEEVKEGLH